MPTVTDILTAAATYHKKTLSDLTINGQNVGLLSLNQVRRNAEMEHDFGFQRRLLTLVVDTVTGGSLDDAVDAVTGTSYEIKTIVEMGTFDQWNNLIPAQWTTTEEGIERQREEDPYCSPRYPTDGQYASIPVGQRRFTITNNQVFYWPKPDVPGTSLNVGIEAYVFDNDWTENVTTVTVTGGTGNTELNTTYYQYGYYMGYRMFASRNPTNGSGTTNNYFIWFNTNGWALSSVLGDTTGNFHAFVSTSQDPSGSWTITSGTYTGTLTVTLVPATTIDATSVWTTKGQQYLQWSTIDELNRYFKTFVPRQEGNLSSPTDLAAAGLDAFIKWDVFKLEGFRRHGR